MRPRSADHTSHDPAPGWVHRLWDEPWLWMALVIALFCVPLFIGLDRQDLDNDEAIYSFSVDVMLKSGDWLTPKSIPSETSAFLEKPPLKFWMTALPIRLGLLPHDEFGLRFMDAFMGSLAFLYVFAIGRRLAGPVCGLASVLLLFTHGELLFQHGLRTNNMEAAVVLAYCGGVYHFLAWRSFNPDVKRHVFAMALYFVLGFMTKFVAVLFLPVILGAAALLTRADRGRLYRDWPTFVWAGLMAVALIVPWFVYQYFERGPRLFDIMFGAHVVQRFTTYLDPTHLHPWHYYFSQIRAELLTAGSAVLTIVGGLLILARIGRRRCVECAVIVLWFAVPLGLISTGSSKLYHYAYPFLPPVALAGGYASATAARLLFGWLARPFAAADRLRDRRLPALMRSSAVRIGMTAAGLALLAMAAATFAFGRLRLAFGDLVLRNSSVARPAVAGAAALLIGAPSAVLRGGLVAAVVLAAMPITAYQANIARTGSTHLPLRQLRDCLAPIVADAVAAGRNPPGVMVESRSLSFVFTYYLRSLGPWMQRDVTSDGTVVMHLLAPNNFRPVVLSRERYGEVMTRLVEDRANLMGRAARMAELDSAALESSADETALGLVNFPSEIVLLPGPYGVCASERIRVTSR